MAIKKRIMKENIDNHEAYMYLYTKLNAKPGEKQKYGGYHLGKPGDKYHHSATDEELDLDISKYDFKFEVLHYGTKSEMKTKEHMILKDVDAKNNPEWYNKHNGSPSSDVKEIDLLAISNMAEEINKTSSFGGIQSHIVTYEKKTMRSEIKKLYQKLQVRFEEMITSNSKSISSWVDKYLGDIEQLLVEEGIHLIVVVLKDVRDRAGDVCDLIVGGNHTIEGILSSKHGTKIRYLTITKEKHNLDYDSAKQLGSFLNKPDKQPGESSSEPSLLKQLVSLCEDFGYNSKSEQIEECLDLNNLDPVEKKKIKTKLTKLLKKNSLANLMWKRYDTEEGKLELEQKKLSLTKLYPTARIFIASSGNANIGRMMVKLSNEIRALTALSHLERAGAILYDKVIVQMYHPSPEAQQKWFADILPGDKDFVEMTCEAIENRYSDIKELNFDFIYMDTNKADVA
jgi:hypothetical protein